MFHLPVSMTWNRSLSLHSFTAQFHMIILSFPWSHRCVSLFSLSSPTGARFHSSDRARTGFPSRGRGAPAARVRAGGPAAGFNSRGGGPATTSCPRMAPPSTGARASSAKRPWFSRDPPYSSSPYVVGRTPPSSSVGTRRGRCWRSARRSPPTCARALAGGARGGGPLAPAHGRRARGADARKLLERGARGGGGRGCASEKKTGVVDETNVSPQWGFHAITNILETTLIRFIPTKPFPSLSSQFHAKISFFWCDTPFNMHETPHKTSLRPALSLCEPYGRSERQHNLVCKETSDWPHSWGLRGIPFQQWRLGPAVFFCFLSPWCNQLRNN
jgi:hypothetical protein